jgi:hypothetical protein
VGAASSRDRMARGRVSCPAGGGQVHKGVTPGRDRAIDSIAVRPCLAAGWLTKSGVLPYIEENVVAPDALCFADDPASGAAPCCTAGSRASSGLEPCDVLRSMPQVRAPAVARWHGHFHDLATASRASCGLDHAGKRDTCNLQGRVTALKKGGLDLLSPQARD